MKIQEGLLYTEEHVWVKVDGDLATVGITDYAQDSLGSIVFIEFPEEDEVEAGEAIGSLESMKTASDFIAPVSGEVIEVNEDLEDELDNITSNPYDSWICKIEMSDKDELDDLLSPEEYEDLLEDL